jgi:NADH:ubiquinone oxidoreductase subunit 3 (subunit A)
MQGVETLVIEYLPVVIFLAVAVVLSCLFLVASTLKSCQRTSAGSTRSTTRA